MSIAEPYVESQEHPDVEKLLAGKTALVTGASRGIGRAVAIALADAGADIAINYQSKAELAEQCCEAVQARGPRAKAYSANISREEESQRMVDAVLDDFGHVDILVNNAGITRDKSFLKMTRRLWDEVLGVNLNGAVQRHPRRAARHGRSRLGPHHQHGLDRRPDRQLRPGQLRGHQGRADRLHHDAGPRSRPQGRHRQRRGAGLHRDRHDQGSCRKRRWRRSRR